MSHETYLWIKLVHFIGFMIWVGSIFALVHMLREPTEGSGDARRLLAILARRAGRAMDIGAALAIAAGVILLVKMPAEVRPLQQPYFHIKLTLVAGLVVLHGFVRMKAGKLAQGETRPVAAALLAATVVLAIGILGIVLVGPYYLHK